MNYLEELRRQLCLVNEFIEGTPRLPGWEEATEQAWEIWCAGQLPGYPELYDPSDWRKYNSPISYIWKDYVEWLECKGSEGYKDMAEYAQQAREFEAQIQGLLEE